MAPENQTTKAAPEKEQPEKKKLHIFVNRRKFEEKDGVKEIMKGREIADLVKTPHAQAVVKRETGPDQREIGLEEDVEIRQADHFLVTRSEVNGGHVS